MNLKLELNKYYSKKKRKTDYSKYLGKDYDKTTNANEIHNDFRNTIVNNIKSVNHISNKLDKINVNSMNRNNKRFTFESNNNNKIMIAESFNLTSLDFDKTNVKKHSDKKKTEEKIEEKKFLFNVNNNSYKNSLFCECIKYSKGNKFYNKICKSFYKFNLEEIPNEIYLTYSLKFGQHTIKNKNLIEKEILKSKIKDEYIFNKILKVLWVISVSIKNLDNFKEIKYICHGLLYHMEEELVYYIFNDIYNKMDLNSIYNKNSYEFYIHIKSLKILFDNQFKEFSEYLDKNEISLEYFLNDWILTLCTKFIPLEKNYWLFNGIFEEGWVYIYRIILKYYQTIFPLIQKDKIYLKKLPKINIHWNSILN